MMLAFTVAWICYCRREYRLLRILVLIPASITLMWFLNAFRIAALIMIGNGGARAVALGGFHSQAGWIAFNASALGFVFAASRIQWLKAAGYQAIPAPTFDYRAAAYLMPFLAILASAMVCRSVSAGFEWLYPLRFLVAGAALWCFREQYRLLDWRISWFAPLIGIAVFLLWIALDCLAGGGSRAIVRFPPRCPRCRLGPGPYGWQDASALPSSPSRSPKSWHSAGSLAAAWSRRSSMQSIPARVTWVSILAFSLLFGVLHGSRWGAGALAGLLFAAAYVRRGRIGDAVLAHSVTNALLAGWVILQGSMGDVVT